MTKRFRIGVISSVHGIHGECKVFVTSDSPERFKKLKTVRAVRPQDPLSGAKGGEETELELVSVRFFNNMAICRFRGIDTPEEIRKYRGMELWIDRSEAVPLEKDEFYIADLIGMQVYDEDGNGLGTLKEVLQTGANDVYVVDGEQGERLIPAIHQCILKVEVDEGRMTVHLLEGL